MSPVCRQCGKKSDNPICMRCERGDGAKASIPSAWTPGPWSSERDLPYNRMPRVHGGDRSLICEVGNMGTTQDQWEANARLIAAAPEMDAELAEVCEAIRELRLADGHAARTGDESRCDRALAAICQHENRIRLLQAKARGDQ